MATIDMLYLNEKCRLTQATEGSMGYDTYVNLDGPMTIKAGEMKLVSLGFKVDTKESNLGVFLYPRSSTPIRTGLILMNSVGVIDSDYRGEVMACLYNTGLVGDYDIQPLDKLVQAVFMRKEYTQLRDVNELPMTVRSDGGFGSTDK